MFKVNQKEIEAFANALTQLDEAFVNLMQAGRRIINILETKDGIKWDLKAPKMTVLTGDICVECGMAALARTGTCITCQACGWNSGCS